MKIFELHFNPKKKQEAVFDSFVFEPETSSEKPLGNLYMIGKFTKILPQNLKFLNDLARTIKQEYYSTGRMTEALQKTNEFLDKEARSGNVNWLGNLHFGILSLAPHKNSWAMNLSKAGEIKIILSRKGELLDIGQNLEVREIEPYPLKIFGNVVTGKIEPEDKIILLTKEVFSLLSQKGDFLNRIKNITEEKEVKKLLKENKNLLSETAGICLLIIVPGKKTGSTATKHLRDSTPKRPLLKLPAIKCPGVKCPPVLKKKSIRLILALLLIFLIGFLIFSSPGEEKKEETQEVQAVNITELLQEAEERINKSYEQIIVGNTEEAKALLEEAKIIIGEIEEEETDSLQEQIQNLLDMINGG